MIEFLREWQVLLIPLCVMIISQTIKVSLQRIRDGSFGWNQLNSYGGMPSSHTAMFVSASFIVGLQEGFTSSLFAVIFFVTGVTIRDAMGIRWSLGFHGKVLNHLIQKLPEEERKLFPKKLHDRLGHTQNEVLAGAALGLLLTLLFYLLIN